MGSIIDLKQERINGMRAGDLMAPIRSEADLTGMLYFSKMQWKLLRDEGRDRTFGKLIKDGQEVEYTEMITLEMVQENPLTTPLFPDAVLIGTGKFDHFTDEKGIKW